MQLYQYDTGYRYNSDTLLLYHFISTFHPQGRVLDVGCGCGILGLLLKRDFPRIEMNLIDIQEANSHLARENAQLNSLDIAQIDCGDFLQMSVETKYDMIVSNPPFYHHGVVKSTNESLFLSRHSSAMPFDAFAMKVTKSLSNRGYFCFCYDAKQIDLLFKGLSAAKLNVEDICFVYPSRDKEASLVMMRARKNSKSLCRVHAPLYIYKGEQFSNEVQAIFNQSQTKSLVWPN